MLKKYKRIQKKENDNSINDFTEIFANRLNKIWKWTWTLRLAA